MLSLCNDGERKKEKNGHGRIIFHRLAQTRQEMPRNAVPLLGGAVLPSSSPPIHRFHSSSRVGLRCSPFRLLPKPTVKLDRLCLDVYTVTPTYQPDRMFEPFHTNSTWLRIIIGLRCLYASPLPNLLMSVYLWSWVEVGVVLSCCSFLPSFTSPSFPSMYYAISTPAKNAIPE